MRCTLDDLQTTLERMPFRYINRSLSLVSPSAKVFLSLHALSYLHTFPPGSSSLQSQGFTKGYVITVEGELGCSFIFPVNFLSFFYLYALIATYSVFLLSSWTCSLLVKSITIPHFCLMRSSFLCSMKSGHILTDELINLCWLFKDKV